MYMYKTLNEIAELENNFGGKLKLALYLNKKYLKSEDADFIECVLSEITDFLDHISQDENEVHRVLLFPPLRKKYRYLIHSFVEEHFSELFSFSVCDEGNRRTVVCDKEHILRCMKSGRCINENVLEWAYKKRLIGLPPKKPPYHKEMEKAQPRISPIAPSGSAGQRQRTKRPDKQLYVPRARRSDASSGDEATQSNEKPHLSSSPQSAKMMLEVTDKKLQTSRVHLNTVENSKSAQENPRRTSEVLTNRPLRNDAPKNLPDVVPVERKRICDKECRTINANKNYLCERNIVQKSSPGDNPRVNCSRKSSASDLVNIKTNDNRRIDRISSARSEIARKEDIPVPTCEKNLQKSSLSITFDKVSRVASARKSSLSEKDANTLALEEGKVESGSSLRTTIKSNISERKNVQQALSSIRTREKSCAERIRKLSLNNQKATRLPGEQIMNGSESIDSVTSVENVIKTKDHRERINVRISPPSQKSNDSNCKRAQDSHLNNDKVQFVSVNDDDIESSDSESSIRGTAKHKSIEMKDEQKSISSIENTGIIHDESSPSNRKPSERLADEVDLDAKESIGCMYLIHEIKTTGNFSLNDQESTVYSKRSDDLHIPCLKEITVSEKDMKANDDTCISLKTLCKNDMKLSCSKSSVTADVESIQNMCCIAEKECETLVSADVKESHDISTIAVTRGSRPDYLLPVENSSSGNSCMIPTRDSSLKDFIVHEAPLIEIDRNTEEVISSQYLENLQILLKNEISGNLSTVRNDHVENSFLIEENELEGNDKHQKLKDCSEATIAAGQHLDEDWLQLEEESLDQSKMGEDSWDSLFDENGDCLNPSVMTELTDTLGKVDIQKAKYDYLEFQPQDPDLSGEEFSHIVELYDFPAEFKTQDLMSTLSTFRERGFNIKWIDDTHALAVFSSPIAATEALSIQHPLVKLRPLSQAISGSKWKAKRFSDDLLPYKPRPQTTASLARRLVSGALGLKVSISKEQRDQERQRLQQAKERKRQVAKQKQDVWDGSVK